MSDPAYVPPAPTAIKALVVRAPWWCEIGRGTKPIEYRSWPTKYRGPMAIVAAKRKDSGQFAGMAVCTVDLVDCVRFGEKDYGWTLSNPRMIVPVPVKGRLGLIDLAIPIDFRVEYDWPDAVDPDEAAGDNPTLDALDRWVADRKG